MKNKFLLITICVAAIFNANATVRTVSNNTASPGQYTSLQTAIDSANAGDTLYVEPSPYDYGVLNIAKQLYLIGGGGTPYTYQFNYSTQVDAVNFNANSNYPYNNASGSTLIGFQVGGSGLTINGGLKNITIARDYLANTMIVTGPDTGALIINNIFSNNYLFIYSQAQNDITALVANNFFDAVPPIRGYGASEVGIIVENNIFYGSGTNNSNQSAFFTSTPEYLTVKNNIYYGVGSSAQSFISGCSNCNFQNNITWSPNTNQPTGNQVLPDAGNSGMNNFSDQNPDFVNGPAVYAAITSSQLFNYNWSLTAGSPGHNAGTDGTDVGIYGGQYPMPNLEGVTRLPQVRQLNITNTSVAPSGTLNVNFVGTTRN